MSSNGDACIFCRDSTNDPLRYGEKYTHKGISVHYYCLLLTSNLTQSGEDDEGILGFMPDKIEAEAKRTNQLLCAFCNERGASIGCCIRSCRKSFHLPCALQAHCQLEFTGSFRSFCDLHNRHKKPQKVHAPTDPCSICFDEMGPYDLVESIQSPCCSEDTWYHKWCVARYAQTSGYFLRCPLCKDSKKFRNSIMKRGIFIPQRDAAWESSEQNDFYGFQEQTWRPKKCQFTQCKCPKGRKFCSKDENSRYFLETCNHCGSRCAHRICSKAKKFICKECLAIEDAKKKNASQADTNTAQAVSNRRQKKDSNNWYARVDASQLAEFNKRKVVIPLRRINLEKLQYDANGRIIIENEDFDKPCDAAEPNGDHVVDINDNSTDLNLELEHRMANSTQKPTTSTPPMDYSASQSDLKDSADDKRQRLNNSGYSPLVRLRDTRSQNSTVFYKTSKTEKANDSLSSSSATSSSGFDDQSSFSSTRSIFGSCDLKSPQKFGSCSTIRSYFSTSSTNSSYDEQLPTIPTRKRKRSTPRKSLPPINPAEQPTILDMFSKKL